MMRIACICASLCIAAPAFAADSPYVHPLGWPVIYRLVGDTVKMQDFETNENLLSIPKATYMKVVDYRAFKLDTPAMTIEAIRIQHRRYLVLLNTGLTLMLDPVGFSGVLKAQVFQHGNGTRHFVVWSTQMRKVIFALSIDWRGAIHLREDYELDFGLAEADMRSGQLIRGTKPKAVIGLDRFGVVRPIESVGISMTDIASRDRLRYLLGPFIDLKASTGNQTTVMPSSTWHITVSGMTSGDEDAIEIVANADGFVGVRKAHDDGWFAILSPPRLKPYRRLLPGVSLPPELLIDYEDPSGPKEGIPEVSVDGDVITVVSGRESKSYSLSWILNNRVVSTPNNSIQREEVLFQTAPVPGSSDLVIISFRDGRVAVGERTNRGDILPLYTLIDERRLGWSVEDGWLGNVSPPLLRFEPDGAPTDLVIETSDTGEIKIPIANLARPLCRGFTRAQTIPRRNSFGQ